MLYIVNTEEIVRKVWLVEAGSEKDARESIEQDQSDDGLLDEYGDHFSVDSVFPLNDEYKEMYGII